MFAQKQISITDPKIVNIYNSYNQKGFIVRLLGHLFILIDL